MQGKQPLKNIRSQNPHLALRKLWHFCHNVHHRWSLATKSHVLNSPLLYFSINNIITSVWQQRGWSDSTRVGGNMLSDNHKTRTINRLKRSYWKKQTSWILPRPAPATPDQEAECASVSSHMLIARLPLLEFCNMSHSQMRQMQCAESIDKPFCAEDASTQFLVQTSRLSCFQHLYFIIEKISVQPEGPPLSLLAIWVLRAALVIVGNIPKNIFWIHY